MDNRHSLRSHQCSNNYLFEIAFAVFGKTILVGRVLAALVGVATIISLFLIGRSLFRSPAAGLLAAAAYAFIPSIIVTNRYGFPQAMTGLILLWSFALFWHAYTRGRQRDADVAALVLSLAFLMQFWSWIAILMIPLALRGLGGARIVRAVLLAMAPVIIVLVIRLATVPTAFLHDVAVFLHGGNVLNPDPSLPFLQYPLTGLTMFFSRSPLFIAAAIGLCFVRPLPLRRLLAVSLVALALPVIVFRADFRNFLYPAMVFIPLLLLGFGGIVPLAQRLEQRLRIPLRLPLAVAFACLLVVYLTTTTIALANRTTGRLAAERAYITNDDTSLMQATIEAINTATRPEDFVIAPNEINWALRAKTVDVAWVTCYERQRFFPNLWPERFDLPLAYRDASFVVVDRLFPGDASICQRYVPEIERIATQDSWPIAYANSRFTVYRNPALRS